MLTSNRLGRVPQLVDAASGGRLLKRGIEGDGVAVVQDVLADFRFSLVRSFSKGRPDGIFGAETEAAVKAFQTRHQLQADGVAGPLTLAKLDLLVRTTPFLDTVPPTAALVQRASRRPLVA